MDVDECASDALNDCEHVCIDEQDGYRYVMSFCCVSTFVIERERGLHDVKDNIDIIMPVATYTQYFILMQSAKEIKYSFG